MFKDDHLNNESTSSSSDESESSATDNPQPNGQPNGVTTRESQKGDSTPEVDETGSASPEKSNEIRQDGSKLQWNDVFGHQSSVLAKLVSPAIASHKKKFEIGLNENVFLGWPVFSRPDGTWTKKRKLRSLSSKSNILGGGRSSAGARRTKSTAAESASEDNEASGLHNRGESRSDSHQDERVSEGNSLQNDSEPMQSDINSKSDIDAIDPSLQPQSTKDSLTMFHVVFVVNPPPLEYHLRVKEMYDNVVKKFSRALKWEQSRSNFVGKEASNISSLIKYMTKQSSEKQALATLYHDLLSQSSLARAISTIYNNVSSSRIAHVSLTPTLSLSLQIPIPTSISVLPTPLLPQLPGLWLTTANALPTDDDFQTAGSQLGAHFTLLLLSDLHTIMSDINATRSEITGPLTHYLRVSKPTKSFLQISQLSGIALSDIQFLASHLVYWRRARAIPPLHQRDIYIVSPNADMRNLASASSSFAKHFPALPPLPKILSMLSSGQRPFSSLVPSRDHKEAYMEILAWLMRNGWVTQLRTFAWIRIPTHIKEDTIKDADISGHEVSPQPDEQEYRESATASASASSSHLDIPQSRSGSPASSTHTTVPINQSNPPSLPIIIPNPRLASDLPSRFLSAVSKHVFQRQGTDSQSAWDKCVKYFDGKHALETIPAREGWKRKRVAELVSGWDGLGLLVRGRHW